jgi:hypothetical protein
MEAARLSPPSPAKPLTNKTMPPKSLTTDDVVEFLAKLTSVQRATLLARVEKLIETRSAPGKSVPPKAKSDPPPKPKVEAAPKPKVEAIPRPKSEPPPPMRPTLPSADVEDVHDALEPAQTAHDVKPASPPSVPPPVPASVAKPASVPPPPPSGPRARPEELAPQAPPPRASMPEITDILFDAMHELNFFESAVEGASFCLVTAMRVVPCLAGLVHLYDAAAGDFVTVYAQGPRSEQLLGSRTPASDALFARASRGRKAVVVTYGADAESEPMCPRHGFFGEPWSAAVAPVSRGGQMVAVLELIDPLDGAPFGEDAEAGLVYIAEHYADFLVQHGIEFGKIVAPPG